ncbi:MAG: hypothetical protein AB1679_03470 [Actinomycetota bacterium]
MDVRTAWNTWTESGSPNAAAEFLDRVGAWTEGTAAQLTREARRLSPSPMSRDEVADRLRHHLGVVAGGEPVTYVEALERARREVIEELRERR